MDKKKKNYIEYKLKGLLDDKICYTKKHSDYNKNDTIKEDFKKRFEISDKEYDNFVKKYEDDNIEKIKELFSKHKDAFKGEIIKFYDWYKSKDECCYCGVKKNDLSKYFNENNEQYKEARQRGRRLELERIQTAPKIKNVYSYDNCDLACYICNNAKSDFISAKDFKPLALGINKFWNNIEEVDAKFPEKSDIWHKYEE